MRVMTGDKRITKFKIDDGKYLRQKGKKHIEIYSPILNFSIEEVWAALDYDDYPNSISAKRLMALYKTAGAECPILVDPQSPPCGRSRFGCWCCTVVRNDKALNSLIKNGYTDLAPLLNFRNWLVEFRDNIRYRCHWRRNGKFGIGPFTLFARKEILARLIDAQEQSGYRLISNEEIVQIKSQWQMDEQNPKYIGIERDTARTLREMNFEKAPWLVVPDNGSNHETIKLWIEGKSIKEIGALTNTNPKLIRNRLSAWRVTYGERVIPRWKQGKRALNNKIC